MLFKRITLMVIALIILVGLVGCSTSDSTNTINYKLTVSVKPVGVGQVSIDPEKEYYKAGEKVTLDPIGTDSYNFAYWEGSGYNAITDDPLQVTMTDDLILVANFSSTQSLTNENLLKVEITWPEGDCDLGIWEPDNIYYWITEGSSSNGIFTENVTNGGTESWVIREFHDAGFYSPLVRSHDYSGQVNCTLTFKGETFNMSIDVEPGIEYIIYDFEITE